MELFIILAHLCLAGLVLHYLCWGEEAKRQKAKKIEPETSNEEEGGEQK